MTADVQKLAFLRLLYKQPEPSALTPERPISTPLRLRSDTVSSISKHCNLAQLQQ